MIPRGSGDHQVTGSTVQGKIPLRYAWRNWGTDSDPPTATNPSGFARRASGKRSVLSRKAIGTRLARSDSGSVGGPLFFKRLEKACLQEARRVHGPEIGGGFFVNQI